MTTLEKLTELSRKLSGLLVDPQPGLSTWNSFLHNTINELYSIVGLNDVKKVDTALPTLTEIESELRKHSSEIDRYALYQAGVKDCYDIINRKK